MNPETHELRPEDYVEPRCVLCDEPYGAAPEVKAIPQQRVIQKMDEYMSHRDYAGAERHLLYWLEEAKLGHDLRGQLLVNNELVGHYRKVSNRERAFACAEEALRLLDELDFGGTISSGTTYINIATAYQAFGETEAALPLFTKARAVYESSDRTDPQLLGGLYNNMALAYAALGRYDEANALYDLAMQAMSRVDCGEWEQAITCLNRANAVEAEVGMEAGESRIFDLLDQAWELLDKPGLPRNGYYAFICEKCAPTFSYYGYFAAARTLTERSEAIYAGT